MKPSGKIQVLVGMIASGKSTYARNAARNGVICVNDDAVVNLVHADDYTLYDKTLKTLYKSTENHIISVALAMGRTVLVDRGLNLSLRGRQRWLSLAQGFDLPCEVIQFPIEAPAVHAERRAKSDPRGHDFAYWLRVAEHHFSEYVPPTLDEGFSAIYDITFADVMEGWTHE
jgi:predicted kinase